MLQAFVELRGIHYLLDEAEKGLERQLGVPICIPNCGICCEQNVTTVHSIEASLILSYLLGTNKLFYIDAARAWLLDKDPCVITYEGMPKGLITGKMREEWDHLSRQPCILYERITKMCSVHVCRPLPCRTFGVTRVPSEIPCPRPLGMGESSDQRMYVGGESQRIIRTEVDIFLSRTKTRNPDWVKHGFLPTMLFRQTREKEFRDLITDNKIASAKLVGLDYSTQKLWQSQVDEDNARNLIRA